MKKILIVLFLLSILSQNTAFCQWVQTNGPTGGTIKCLTTVNNHIYAGTSGGGVFISSDSGKSWKAINSGFTRFFTAVALTNDGSKVYMAADSFGTGELYEMKDGDNYWTPFKSLNDGVNGLCVSGNHIFYTSESYVYESDDTGHTWRSVDNGLYSYSTNHDIKIFNDTVFLCNDFGLYYKPLDSSTWLLNYPNINGGEEPQSLIFAGTTLYVGTQDDGVFVSTNHTSFQQLPSINGQPTSVYAIVSSDTNLFIASVDYGGVFKYSFKTQSWSNIFIKAVENPYANDLVLFDSTLFVASISGIYKTVKNDSTWIEADSGLVASNPSTFAVIDSNMVTISLLGCPGSKCYRTSDLGKHWHFITDSIMQTCSLAGSTTIGKYFIMGSYMSKDNGINWVENNPSAATFVKNTDGNIYSGDPGFDLLYLSSDTCQNWQISPSTDVGPIENGVKKGQYFFVSCLVLGNDTTNLKTKDFGKTWESTNFPYGWFADQFIAMDSLLFYGIGFNSAWIFMSPDNGKTVYEIDSNKIAGNLSTLYTVNHYLFAGASSGLYFSPDSGITWQLENEGLINTNVLSISSNDSFLLIGIGSEGIWKRPLSDFANVTTNLKSVKNYSLGLNIYPNPANDYIEVSIRNVSIEDAEIRIINTLGQTVFYQANSNLQKFISEKINTASLPPGLYMLNITTSNKSESEKFIKE